MAEHAMDVIIRAQTLLMEVHDLTSETALGLLVWAATDEGVTVLEVSRTICESTTHEGLLMTSPPAYAAVS